MDYIDIEGATYRGSYLRTLKRKWNGIPRVLRLYLVLIFVFATITISYYYIFDATKSSESHLTVSRESRHENNADADKVEDVLAKNQFTVVPRHGLEGSEKSDQLTVRELELAAQRQNSQQRQIQEAILHSWSAYRKYSWGYDHLKPLTKRGHNWFGIGLTILDSLDTLLIAGLTNEYNQALEWVRNDLSFEVNDHVNCFETTIRALGGLLSAYHLSRESVLLEKAKDLGDRLIHCFDSRSPVPFSDVNLKMKTAKAPAWSPDSSVSEVSSVQLEFRDLSFETDAKFYEEKSFATSKHIHEQVQLRNDPLVPMYINPHSGHFSPSTITLGARADSYYEYLYKQYLQTHIDFFLEDYIKSIDAIKKRLMRTTPGKLKLAYIGEIQVANVHDIFPKMDHLVCFLSGTLALGYYHESKSGVDQYRGHPVSSRNETFGEHLQMAEDLARTCHYMYNLTETGLSPEIAFFGQAETEDEFYIKPRDAHNLLRPEFVESLFFLYHITRKPIYREWGVQIFEAFQKYSRVASGGYTTIDDCRHPHNVKPKDMMESFWIAETLKYLYLLFSDEQEIIDKILNNYIFNSEGHLLLRRVKS